MDFRECLRSLLRTPRVTLSCVTLLAIAMTGVLTLFLPLQTIVLAPLPFSRAEELVAVDGPVLDVYSNSFPNRDALSAVFSGLAAYQTNDSALVTLTSDDLVPRRAVVTGVTVEFFSTLGVRIFSGRDFATTDYVHGVDKSARDAAVAVISFSLWRTQFGGKEAHPKTLSIGPARFAVVGVAPEGFRFPDNTDVWVPARAPYAAGGRHRIIGRLQPGQSVPQATDRVRIISSQALSRENTTDLKRIKIESLQTSLLGDRRATLWSLWALSIVFFALACSGVANLLFAHYTRRRSEIATRMALGASRARIVAQLLAETVTISLVGTLASVCLSRAAVRIMQWSFPTIDAISPGIVSANSVLLVIGLPLVATFVCGTGPALSASRPSGALSITKGMSKPRLRLRRRAGLPLLACGQLALAMVLLLCTVLLVRSLLRVVRIPLGFDPEHVIVVRVDIPPSRERFETSRLRNEAQREGGAAGQSGTAGKIVEANETARATEYAQQRAWHAETFEALRTLPDVELVAWLMPTPFGKSSEQMRSILPIDPYDGSLAAEHINGLVRSISPNTFRLLGMQLRRGRTVSDQDMVVPRLLRQGDMSKNPDVAVVNETLAKRLALDGNVIGRELLVGYTVVIVGVVSDIRESASRLDPVPTVYVPAFPETSAWNFVVKVSSGASISAVATALPAILMSRVPALPRPTITLLTTDIAAPLRYLRFACYLLACFATLGLTVASLGVYATSSEASAAHTQEIGVRMALGATPRNIRNLAIWRGCRTVIVALPAGAFGAWVAARVASNWLVGIERFHALSFVLCSALLVALALIASLPAAVRAAKVDPALVLRRET